MMDYEKVINILEQLKDEINGGRWVDLFNEDGGYLLALGLAISNLKVVEQCRWERDIATEQLHELGLGLGQKVDGIKELIEKSKPMKPNEVEGVYEITKPVCPRCGNDLFEKYCCECGQKIDI